MRGRARLSLRTLLGLVALAALALSLSPGLLPPPGPATAAALARHHLGVAGRGHAYLVPDSYGGWLVTLPDASGRPVQLHVSRRRRVEPFDPRNPDHFPKDPMQAQQFRRARPLYVPDPSAPAPRRRPRAARAFRPGGEALEGRLMLTGNGPTLTGSFTTPVVSDPGGNPSNDPTVMAAFVDVGQKVSFRVQVVNYGNALLSEADWTFAGLVTATYQPDYGVASPATSPFRDAPHPNDQQTGTSTSNSGAFYVTAPASAEYDEKVTVTTYAGPTLNFTFKLFVQAPQATAGVQLVNSAGAPLGADNPVFGWVNGANNVSPVPGSDAPSGGTSLVGFDEPSPVYFSAAAANGTPYGGRFGFVQLVTATLTVRYNDGETWDGRINQIYDTTHAPYFSASPVLPMWDGAEGDTSWFYQNWFRGIDGNGTNPRALPTFPTDNQLTSSDSGVNNPKDDPAWATPVVSHDGAERYSIFVQSVDFHAKFTTMLTFYVCTQAGAVGIPVALSTLNWSLDVSADCSLAGGDIAAAEMGKYWSVTQAAADLGGVGDRNVHLLPTWTGTSAENSGLHNWQNVPAGDLPPPDIAGPTLALAGPANGAAPPPPAAMTPDPSAAPASAAPASWAPQAADDDLV